MIKILYFENLLEK